MFYIIYDLEFNQKYPIDAEELKSDIKSIPFEIIQIGALKLNKSLEVVDTFNSFIQPTLYKVIHPYVENLTKITTEQVSSYPTFPKVYNEFLSFIGNDETILSVWGTADLSELYKNIYFHDLPITSLPKNYIDIQHHASKHFKNPKGSRIGLKTCVELLNIDVNGEFHDALNDAHYTSEVFKSIYNPNIEPKPYTYIPHIKRKSEPKEVIDNDALISQFEKMYNREMSTEEKNIIQLAYIMGKTNQFLK